MPAKDVSPSLVDENPYGIELGIAIPEFRPVVGGTRNSSFSTSWSMHRSSKVSP